MTLRGDNPSVSAGAAPAGPLSGTPRSKVRRPERRGVPRPRLAEQLDRLWSRRLGVVVAPAGSGKSTLLAQFALAAQSKAEVAWYQADTSDIEPRTLLAGLCDAVSQALRSPFDTWGSVDDAIAALDALEHFSALPLLLVVDDVHTIHSTAAEVELGRLLHYLPPHVHLLLGGRRLPALNLTRIRLDDDLVEVLADDLRFRAWEVETLFRDFYGAPLPPDEMARLARTTEGWAAGLQLFHLATRGRSGAERKRVLERLGTDSGLVREYLTRNVLDELALPVRTFLLDTCVLGRLSASICDQFLATSGSAALLEELERLQLFTQSFEYGDYHYHEVLRSHLEAMLAEQIGSEALRERYLRAGAALEECGAPAEALRAYVCAEDAPAVARILGRSGEELSGRVDEWADLLPSPLLENDPWVQLSHARRLVRDGRPEEASAMYQRAATTFSTVEGRDLCNREHALLQLWLSPQPVTSDASEWIAVVRQATRADPHRLRRNLRAFPEGLVAAIDGDVRSAGPLLARAIEGGGPPVAGVVLGLIRQLSAQRQGAAANHAETRPSHGWLGRFSAGVALLEGTRGAAEVEQIEEAADEHSDRWGAAALALCLGLQELLSGEASPTGARAFLRAVTAFESAGAPVLARWASAGRAVLLARLRDPQAAVVARETVVTSAEHGPRWAYAVAAHVLSSLREQPAEARENWRREAGAVASTLGIALPAVPDGEAAVATRDASLGPGPTEISVTMQDHFAGAPVGLRCFGAFELWLGGSRVDLEGLKPRFRAALRLLASRAGQPVHKGDLALALWPDADEAAAARNVNVALSAIRQAIEPGLRRGASTVIGRDGEAYSFVVGAGTVVDHLELSRCAQRAREALASGDDPGAADGFARALSWYSGDLLAGDGSAEWVTKDRERMRLEATDVAQSLAELLLRMGDARGSAQHAERGLHIDRFRDGLWRVLIAALEADDRPAEAERSRRRYAEALTELGVA